MGKKKNKLKKQQTLLEETIDNVDCIIENDEFLLSRRMGISKSTEPLRLYTGDILHTGDTKYFDTRNGWYQVPDFKTKN